MNINPGIVIGIDEAGRGCWAGPLVAAAVLLQQPIAGLADSKQLTKPRRERLADHIRVHAEVGIGWVSAGEIDAIGLTKATQKAMSEAVSHIRSKAEGIIIDGNFNYLPAHTNVRVLPKADALIPAVSAASIIAKVTRDEYMIGAAKEYPGYHFERHVGYGTALHYQMIKLHGACKLHRLSYKPLQALLKVADV